MYLIVGANGFLGSYILKNILEKTQDSVIAVARDIGMVTAHPRIRWVSCDISDAKEVDVLCRDIKCIGDIKVIFLAACHNPDLVEKNPNQAWNINVTSLSYFVNKLHNIQCFFYPSSDSVYGNSVGSYKFREGDPLGPVNAYGRQKCAAESIVLWYGHHVVRYPFLIAPSRSPLKKHFYDVIVDTLTAGKEIEMFTDSFRSAISFDTGASILIELIENGHRGVPKLLNICGDDAVSKYEIGIRIAEKLGVDKRLVIPVSVTKDRRIFATARAQSTLMDNAKVKGLLGLGEIKLVV